MHFLGFPSRSFSPRNRKSIEGIGSDHPDPLPSESLPSNFCLPTVSLHNGQWTIIGGRGRQGGEGREGRGRVRRRRKFACWRLRRDCIEVASARLFRGEDKGGRGCKTQSRFLGVWRRAVHTLTDACTRIHTAGTRTRGYIHAFQRVFAYIIFRGG